MDLPQRTSLVHETTRVIQTLIKEGELRGHLPGERTLANRLHVGRDTLRAALRVLETSGWITPSTHGKRRKILTPTSQQKPKKSKTQRIGFISPKRLEEFSPLMLTEIDILRSLLNKQGYNLEIHTPGIFHLKTPEARLQSYLDEHQCDLWILHQTTRAIQKWFETNNIPCIARGLPQEGVKLSYLDSDWGAATFHAGSNLIRNGHQSIGLITPDLTLKGLQATEEALQTVINQHCPEGKLHSIRESGSPQAVIDAFRASLDSPQPPTALVVTRSRHVLTLLSWFASVGIKIPDNITLISLAHESWFEHLMPQIDHYRSNPTNMAKSLLRMMNQLLETPSMELQEVMILPEHHSGSSIRSLS